MAWSTFFDAAGISSRRGCLRAANVNRLTGSQAGADASGITPRHHLDTRPGTADNRLPSINQADGYLMKVTKPTAGPRFNGIFFTAALVILLAALFGKSFLPDYVHFSNDAPLGTKQAAWLQLPEALTGMWVDLSDIGGNAAAFPPNLTALESWTLGPVGYAKFSPAIAIFILGAGAWIFFRQLRLSPLAATLGALAAAFNSCFFSDACWGVPSHQIAFGMDFLALALIVSNSPVTPWFVRWVRLALAGFAVGINVVEAADIGAIFSVFVAAFVLFQSLMEEGPTVKKIGRGVGRITIIAALAAFFAAQTITGLVGTQIKGIVGTQQNAETKARQWNFATEWSLPKIETMGIIVPGLFGYRLDTPDGGNYWGAVGRHPSWDRYFTSGEQNPPPEGPLRFTGTGNYAGVLVILVALWTVAQSWRRKNSVFSETHRRFIWFWTAVLIVSLLLAFGRFAPFYAFLYKLPYFSTIRNPVKLLFVFFWAFSIVFACGIHGLSRHYLAVPAAGSASPLVQIKTWWAKNRGFDRHCVSICIVALIGSLLAWLIYRLQMPALVRYLQTVQFDENMAGQIATFSVHQVGWFILFFALAMGLLTLILSGALAGRRARWAGIFLGVLLVGDLGRADLPWVIHWNYEQKYASNPIIDLLREKPYEHRVVVLHSKSLFENLYNIEWSQQLFPYYNIQSLDIVQMSRLPEDLAAYQGALTPVGTPDTVYLIARHWQLTDTRYLLGPANFLESLNEQLDPVQRRFRILQHFDVAPKPGVDAQELNDQLQHGEFHGEKLTAVPSDNGPYALFDFTGALPRARLYSDWQVSTNDTITLQTLASKDFDAWKTVLVSTPLPPAPALNATNKNSGTVEFKSYAPKHIVFDAKAGAPSVLLLNDKFDPAWHVRVDGKSEPLLRCNFIMRGVYLTPGEHTVEFRFSPPLNMFYVSLSAVGVGILLVGCLIFSTRRTTSSS